MTDELPSCWDCRYLYSQLPGPNPYCYYGRHKYGTDGIRTHDELKHCNVFKKDGKPRFSKIPKTWRTA